MSSRIRALARTAMAGVLAVSALGAAGPPAVAAGRPQDAAHPYRHGIAYTREHSNPHGASPATSANNLNYGGGVSGVGVTTGPPRVYLVFWGSQWGSQSTDGSGYLNFSGDPNGMAPYYQAFFTGVGVNSELWSGVMTQYCEGVATGSQTCPGTASHVGYPTGGALAGVWGDAASASPSQSTGNQLGQEAVNAAGHFGNTTSASNRNTQYVIVSPTGTHPDGFNTPNANWCAWHDYTGDSTLSGGGVSSPYGPLAFTNMPYVTDMGASCGQGFVNAGSAGTLDGVSIVGGHEYAETITDQFPAGGWTDSSGAENGDKCAWISSGQGASQDITLSTGTFAVQSTWSNDFNNGAGGCEVSHPIVTNASSNDFSLAVSPSSQSVTAGQSTTYTVTTAVAAGSASTVSLSASGLPSGASASFNPASVTAGGSSTMTVTTSTTTPGGTSTITVSGANGTFTHSGTASLVVTAAPSDFSISVAPASQSVAQGGSTSYTVSTAVTSGSAATITLSAGGLPAGASASFNPASVTAGGSSTMTVSTAGSTPTGTSTITVTGTGGGASHSATSSLTVSAASAGGITNGGFETGDLSGWTSSGAITGVSTTAHSGSYSAMVGGSSPTSGDSAIAQTFTVPSGGGSLSFWYSVHCPDTVTYDWATATLHDNTSGASATLLGKTCTNTGAWVRSAGYSLVAGHSVTLTLASHDDNYPTDPTYTLYDDVAISAPVASPLVNGGFETGSLSGWTSSGASAGVSTTAHSGSYSAMLGGTSPTNGTSNIAQTFTIPSGASTLSFWYQVHCPDTVTYDWATATLHDNTTNTTTTLLARTCTNSGAWVQVTHSVASMAGHSVTLTLTSKDDNYPVDPTYTLYDDVSVS